MNPGVVSPGQITAAVGADFPPNIDVGLRATLDNHADVLLITDGDADRCGIGDENGAFINQLRVFGLLAYYMLEVLGKQLGVPILVDHNALARHDIDPEKAVVAHPQMRTNFSMALRKMLFKAGLKFEIRVDEAEKPFLWISTVKPV